MSSHLSDQPQTQRHDVSQRIAVLASIVEAGGTVSRHSLLNVKQRVDELITELEASRQVAAKLAAIRGVLDA